VIGDVPVGYEDLVEMWFMVIRTLRMVGWSTCISRCPILHDTEEELLTCSGEVSASSGEIRAQDHSLSVCGRRRRRNSRHRMSQKHLPPIQVGGGSEGAIDGAC